MLQEIERSIEFQIPPSVTIVDDDPEYRESLAEELQDFNITPHVIEGRYGDDLPQLVRDIESHDDGLVICDYRLQGRNFANFNGTRLIRALAQAQRPAMLITMFQDTNRLDLRKNRASLPVVVGRNQFNPDDLGTYAEVCRRELANNPIDERRPHRTLIRIEEIRKTPSSYDLYVVVPAWRPEEVLTLPAGCVPNDLLPNICDGRYLLGDVNIGAPTESELFFANVNELVETNEESQT